MRHSHAVHGTGGIPAETSDGISGGGAFPWTPSYYADYVTAIRKGTGYNPTCDPFETQTWETRLTSHRLDNIWMYRDNPALPVVESDVSNWAYHEGFPDAHVAMVSPTTNFFDMYIRGLDHKVWMQRYTSTGWQPSFTSWTPIGGTVTMLGGVAATSRSADQIDLFVRQDNGNQFESATPVCTRARYQSTWWPQNDWYCFSDFVTKESPTAVSSGANALYVFAVQADGSVSWKRWGNLVGWQAPVSLGSATLTDDPVAVVSRAGGYWDAYVRDRATGQICTKAWANGAYCA